MLASEDDEELEDLEEHDEEEDELELLLEESPIEITSSLFCSDLWCIA